MGTNVLKAVFESDDSIQAQLVRGALESQGVWFEGSGRVNPLGIEDRRVPHRVLVHEEDFERASQIVRDITEREPASDRPWTWRCACGEDVEEQFGACWNCGAERGA